MDVRPLAHNVELPRLPASGEVHGYPEATSNVIELVFDFLEGPAHDLVSLLPQQVFPLLLVP